MTGNVIATGKKEIVEMSSLTGGTGATRPRVPLTHRGVEALRGAEIAYRIPDLRCPGLAVRVAPSGLKTWDVAYRIRGAGSGRRLSLGPFPATTLETARERTQALVKAAQAGRDLIAEEKSSAAEAQARTTVGQAIELYLNRKVRGQIRTAHETEIRSNRVFESIRDRYLDEITRRDLRAILEKPLNRGKLREAEKQRQVMRVLFRWAVGEDIIAADPTTGIASFGTSPRRDRVLSNEEIKTFWEWLKSPDVAPDYADALRVQLLTGARIGEVAGISVAEIDQKKWTWTLPAERSKNNRPRVTPLVGMAKAILQSRLERLTEGPMFRMECGRTLTSNCVSSFLKKRRAKISIEHFTSHDLRRTVATGLVELGFPLELVAAALGHEAGGKDVRTLVRHYIRSDLVDRKRTALEKWNSYLEQIVALATVTASNSNISRVDGS
jgi:integrase